MFENCFDKYMTIWEKKINSELTHNKKCLKVEKNST